MAKFNGNRAVVKAHRQLAVEREVVRGRSLREIQAELEGAGHVNPNRGEPWSLGIIQRDVKELETRWATMAAVDLADAKGRQLTELREARRVAWEQKDINQVRQLLKLEMELLGTEAPKRQEVRATVATSEYDGWSYAELRAEFDALARRPTVAPPEASDVATGEGDEDAHA